MSLVGPRPPIPDEVTLYEDWHKLRLNTVPGITGLWQVSGRSDVPFDEMVLLDIYYIENWSLWLDVEILMRTVPRVLLRDGAY
jgi:lipopolysaccharide/colanic/teichoic acid biosynthesis glycosyltransferase